MRIPSDPELGLQPKKAFAEFVESRGLLVPRRFGSIEEAVASGREFVIRSEHPIELTVSGLFESPMVYAGSIEAAKEKEVGLDPESHDIGSLPEDDCYFEDSQLIMQFDVKDEDALRVQLLEYQKRLDSVQEYCALSGTNVDDLLEDYSYSVWELFPGYNRAIAADSSIAGRYHIFTSNDHRWTFGRDRSVPCVIDYTLVDNGNVVVSHSKRNELPAHLRNGLEDVIGWYESLRADGGCPLVEFQTVGSEHYFLQYHWTREFSPSSFKLEDGREGEKVTWVRGATQEDGLVLDLIPVWYGESGKKVFYGEEKLQEEQAAYGLSGMYEELVSRRRVATFLDNYNGDFSTSHTSRSMMLKPQMSVMVPKHRLFRKGEREEFRKRIAEEQRLISFPIHVISDGMTAYVQRLD